MTLGYKLVKVSVDSSGHIVSVLNKQLKVSPFSFIVLNQLGRHVFVPPPPPPPGPTIVVQTYVLFYQDTSKDTYLINQDTSSID